MAAASVLRPPVGLLSRMRWLFLLIGLFAAVAYGVTGTLASAAAGLLWPLTIAATAGLVGTWLYGYARGRFTLAGDLGTGAAIVLLGASLPEPRFMPHAIFASVWIRALHAAPRDVALPTAIYAVAFGAAAALAASPESPFGAYVVGRVLAAALFGAAFSTIALVLAAHERTAAQDRALRAAGRALAEAGDRAAVYAAALAGARGLLGTTPGAVVELAIGASDDLDVVAETGSGTGAPGGRVRLGELPEAVREALVAGRAVEVASADAALWLALDLDPRAGTVYALPLAGRGTFDGALVVGSDAPIDDELKDDLQTLSELAALAVERQIQLDARRAGGAAGAPIAEAGGSPFERARARLGSALAAARPASAAPSVWPMPRELAQRVRWTIMAAALGLALWVGLYGLLELARGPVGPLQLIAAATPLWLGGWFLYGYRRGGFPLIGDVVVGLLLLAVLLSTETYRVTQFALFASLLFRAVYGGRRDVAVAVVVHAAALFGAVALSPGRGLGAAPVSAVVLMFVAVVALAVAIQLTSAALGRHERALVRGRVLRIAGAHLVAATERAQIEEAARDGREALRAAAADGDDAAELKEADETLAALAALAMEEVRLAEAPAQVGA